MRRSSAVAPRDGVGDGLANGPDVQRSRTAGVDEGSSSRRAGQGRDDGSLLAWRAERQVLAGNRRIAGKRRLLLMLRGAAGGRLWTARSHGAPCLGSGHGDNEGDSRFAAQSERRQPAIAQCRVGARRDERSGRTTAPWLLFLGARSGPRRLRNARRRPSLHAGQAHGKRDYMIRTAWSSSTAAALVWAACSPIGMLGVG